MTSDPRRQEEEGLDAFATGYSEGQRDQRTRLRAALEELTSEPDVDVWLDPYAAIAAVRGLLKEPEATKPHDPGDHHKYDLICRVCGQLGVIRLSIDPERTTS